MGKIIKLISKAVKLFKFKLKIFVSLSLLPLIRLAERNGYYVWQIGTSKFSHIDKYGKLFFNVKIQKCSFAQNGIVKAHILHEELLSDKKFWNSIWKNLKK